MADVKGKDRRRLEKLFGMADGYVLDFSDPTFTDFFDEYDVEIDSERYRGRGGSKAKRMRSFWRLDDDGVVGRVIKGLIEYGIEEGRLADEPDLIRECHLISQRLVGDEVVPELDTITASADGAEFDGLSEQVAEAIEKNQPERGLDRLHAWVTKFIRLLCEKHGIDASREKPLHSIFGEYVKALKRGGYIDATMTERILKTNISVLESFNDVRNNKSYAHDNPILNYEESLLVFNHISALVRFLKSIESNINIQATQSDS